MAELYSGPLKQHTDFKIFQDRKGLSQQARAEKHSWNNCHVVTIFGLSLAKNVNIRIMTTASKFALHWQSAGLGLAGVSAADAVIDNTFHQELLRRVAPR